MSPEEMEKKIAELEAWKANAKTSVENAAKIHAAVKNVKNNNPTVGEYIETIASGVAATAPWERATSETAAEVDPDLDTAAALKAQEERLTALFDQKLNQMATLLDQKSTNALNRSMALESQNSVSGVQRWFERTYPTLSWDDYRAKAASLGEDAPALLSNEKGLQTLLKAAIADDAPELARQQLAEEKARKTAMVNEVFGGPQPTTGKGGDEGDFDDLPWDSDPEGALLKAFERTSTHL